MARTQKPQHDRPIDCAALRLLPPGVLEPAAIIAALSIAMDVAASSPGWRRMERDDDSSDAWRHYLDGWRAL
jgi:hypothetical protein